MFAKYLIKPTGEKETLERKLTLEEAQSIVGGYIEPVRMTDSKLCMIVNEEGLIFGLPLNREATRLVHPDVYHHGIRGNALIVTRASL